MKLEKFIGFFILAGYSLVAICDDLTQEKKQNIERLLMYSYTFGAGSELIAKTSKQILFDLKRQHSQLSEVPAADVIKKELINSLIEASIPVYHKNLTNQEIKETFVFLNSAAGKQFFTFFPAILQETGDINQAAAQVTQPRIKTALIKEGLLPDPSKAKLRLDDPFGALPKAAAQNCGPEQRYRFNNRLQSQDDFIRFLSSNLERFKNRGNNSVLLDNYKESRPGMNKQDWPVDWGKVSAALTTEKIGDHLIYKLEYIAATCAGRTSTFKMTDEGHVSVYGCCGK